jgi:hypothetical protein
VYAAAARRGAGSGLAPRAVVVHRRTELAELLARQGTRGQAAFFLRVRGRDLHEVDARDLAQQAALSAVAAAIPVDWRRGAVERAELDRFMFAPEDVVLVVGQDGLVANVAKHLDAQPVVGFNPDPARNPGVLVPHPVAQCAALLAGLTQGRARIQERVMVEAAADDGQCLVALNEIYVGHPSHQTARYRIILPDGTAERQASSGVVTSSGTGATGWCRSIWQERASTLRLPDPAEPALAWFVREAWPSPASGTSATQGLLEDGAELGLIAETEGLVVFGDGMEDDRITLAWGQRVGLRVARHTLRLVQSRM